MSAWRLCGAGAPGQRRSSDRAISSAIRGCLAVLSVGLGSTTLQLPCPESRTVESIELVGRDLGLMAIHASFHRLEALGLHIDQPMVHAISDSAQQSNARNSSTVTLTLLFGNYRTPVLQANLSHTLPACSMHQSKLHWRTTISTASILVSAGSWMRVHWSIISDSSVYAQVNHLLHEVIHYQ